MSGLYKPGVGDLLDRLCVLALKIAYGQRRVGGARQIDHFIEEQLALLAAVGQSPGTARIWDLLQLQTVHALIWQEEDLLRDLRAAEGPTETAGRLAFRLQGLNDQRHILVEKINKATGTGAEGPEKQR